MGFGLKNSTPLKDFWEYDPTTEQWTELAACPCTARSHPAMVEADGKIYVGLGTGTILDLGDWWAYDIIADTWIEQPDFPAQARHHPYYFDINGKIYVGFGHSRQDIFNDFYVFNPETNSWTELARLPAEGRVAGTQFDYKGKGYILSGDGDDHGSMPTDEMWEYDPLKNTCTIRTPHPGRSRWAPGSFVVDGVAYFLFGRLDGENYNDIWAFDLNPAMDTIDLGESDIILYPNPVKDRLLLASKETYDRFEIRDVSGRLMINSNLNSNVINVSELINGIYFIQFFKAEKHTTQKFNVFR